MQANLHTGKSGCYCLCSYQSTIELADALLKLSALNRRLYIIRRLKSHLSTRSITRVVDGLLTSKICYGLQLYGKVRTKKEDLKCADFKSIQILQNDLLRFLNGSKIKDKMSIKFLLNKFGALSVNQLGAQIKLL